MALNRWDQWPLSPLLSEGRVKRAIFIDKDGTLIPDLPYNVDPARITLAQGAGEALGRLKAQGYLLIVVSNQSGIARGLFPEAALIPVRDRLDDLLSAYGAPLDGFFYCPHWPSGTVPQYATACTCRKPQPGMLLSAADELQIDLACSWMIGDITADTEAGRRAGCRTVLIEKQHDPQRVFTRWSRPDYCVHSWAEAEQMIRKAGES